MYFHNKVAVRKRERNKTWKTPAHPEGTSLEVYCSPHLHVPVYANKRVEDVWKEFSGEAMAKARKQDTRQQVL